MYVRAYISTCTRTYTYIHAHIPINTTHVSLETAQTQHESIYAGAMHTYVGICLRNVRAYIKIHEHATRIFLEKAQTHTRASTWLSYMYARIHVYMYTYIYLRIYVHTSIYTNALLYIQLTCPLRKHGHNIRASMQVPYMYIHTFICTYTRTYTYICKYTYLHLYM